MRVLGLVLLPLLWAISGVAHASTEGADFDSTHDTVSQLMVAIIVVGLFVVLTLDKVHRVLVAFSALATIWLISYLTPYKLLSFKTAHEAIDLNVLFLLASMMALVGVLKTTNAFAWAVNQLMHHSGGRPGTAASLIIWFTGVLSALLDNVTTVIFAYPMASDMAKRLKINPSAFLLPMVMAANIGGTATLIGDPPNILIGSGANIPFMEFIYNLAAPCGLMMFALVWFAKRYYPADIGGAWKPTAQSAEGHHVEAELRNVALLKWIAAITVLIFIGFMTQQLTGMPAAVPAVIGVAAILILQDYYYLKTHKPTHKERVHGILHIIEREIEWPTLAFFLFLFMIVGAAVATGMIGSLAQALAWVIQNLGATFGLGRLGTLLLAAIIILWVSGFLSAVIDNIPYVAVTIPVVATLIQTLGGGPETQVLWWALALGACLGGNGTLIGASANVTVVGLAEKDGKTISFGEFTAFGARVTLITLAISTAYLAAWVFVGGALVNYILAAVFLALMLVARLAARRATPATA
jgi:Na+/H+ antiporter NhaD/arsenite permease-like protein